MSEKRLDEGATTLQRYKAALNEAGYEVYEGDGGWYYNGIEYERDPDYADGPYASKGQAIMVAVGNLDLLGEEEDPAAPVPK